MLNDEALPALRALFEPYFNSSDTAAQAKARVESEWWSPSVSFRSGVKGARVPASLASGREVVRL